MFLPPWYLSTFSLHCNCFTSLKQFPEGSAGFWQSASVSHARCLVGPFQRSEEYAMTKSMNLIQTNKKIRDTTVFTAEKQKVSILRFGARTVQRSAEGLFHLS